jgi:cell division septation protein DedD
MEKIMSYIFGVSRETLRNGFELGKVPEVLRDPLQSLLPRITREASKKPTSIYVASDEDTAEIRNLFGYALANALLQHVPSTLLVDCGFLDIGLSGVVPQKDALGFLDLLLYGSSLGVITQETTGGVHVVGAGSFPVTKKMPFVLTAFEEASRRLVGHCRCAIFCGPLQEDGGELHSLIGAVDIPVLVRAVGKAAAGVVDPIEEQISARWDTELLSVRITPAEGRAVPEKAAGQAETILEEPGEPEAPIEVAEEPESEAKPVEAEPRFEEMVDGATVPPNDERPTAPPEKPVPARTASRESVPEKPSESVELVEEPLATHVERRYTSLLPKIVTAAVALVVIVFIVWWVNEERTTGETTPTREATRTEETTQPPTDGQAGAEDQEMTTDTVAVRRETSAPPPAEQSPATVPEESAPGQVETISDEQPTRTTSSASTRIDSHNIIVMDDLENNWGGYFLVHISSFRESDKARNEVASLQRRGLPVFIVFLNLGTKGSWYRVYAGPLDTREDARNMKKLLDDTPGVRFTRITQVPR